MNEPAKFHGLERIVSGGQTGVDRAALDVAIDLGIPHGGWCPKGRLAEDGTIPSRYSLQEMESADYTVRTEQNVLDSDGTLILYQRRLQGGTLLTHRLAKRHQKPLLRYRLDLAPRIDTVIRWLVENDIKTLNVAGPRGSSSPEIEEMTRRALRAILLEPRLINDWS